MPSYVRGDSNFDTASAEKLTLMTAQNSTSGTAIDFVGIPSWAKRVTVMFDSLSTSGTSIILVQLGASYVVTSGYVCSGTVAVNNGAISIGTYTTGFPIALNVLAANYVTGKLYLNLVSSNKWNGDGTSNVVNGTYTKSNVNGSVTLSGTLDRIRITTVNGTDTFDAGSINVMYEG